MRRYVCLAPRWARLRPSLCSSKAPLSAILSPNQPYIQTFTRTLVAASDSQALKIVPHHRKVESNPQTRLSDSTIYALSSGTGRAGIAVIRISGSGCLDIYRGLCPSKGLPKPRFATVRQLFDPENGDNVLDSEALLLYFPSPKTVTGEDVVELHVHGGAATVRAVLAALPKCESSSHIRYAEAGEFTRRAFQNGRLDLAQVEALSDTLSAETELQRRAAVRGNSGILGRRYEKWRHELLYARGEVEAFIDFYEDQDFDTNEAEMLKSIEDQIRGIQAAIAMHIEAGRRGELLRKGIRISMLGPPNAGKSSLLNRIVGREASIVSSEAGTTRDIVEVSLDLEGYLCTFADTAGLRSSFGDGQSHTSQSGNSQVGEIEAEGIRRAKAKARDSDMIIVFASVERSIDGPTIVYDSESLEIAADAKGYMVVINKIDVLSEDELADLYDSFVKDISSQIPGILPDQIIPISCKAAKLDPTFQNVGNIKSFVDGLVASFKSMTTTENEDLYGVTERQNQLLSQCQVSLGQYLDEVTIHGSPNDDFDIVLAAEYLRTAADCLSRITGRGEAGDVEEVLGVVFEKFCVGK